MLIDLVAFDGVDEMDVLGPLEVFRSAASAGVEVTARVGRIRAPWANTGEASGYLEASGATLVRDRVVDDGDLVTSGGVTSGIDLALWLLGREFSFDLAERVARRMEYPRVRPASAPPIL